MCQRCCPGRGRGWREGRPGSEVALMDLRGLLQYQPLIGFALQGREGRKKGVNPQSGSLKVS